VCPERKPQQKILWAEVLKESGRRKSQWRIRDLVADGRCSQAVLDFLSTTDVGRLVPAEEDAGSSEWERRERREREEERRVEMEEFGCRRGGTALSPAALLHGACGGGVGDGSRFPHPFLCFSFVVPSVTSSLLCVFYSLGTGLGGGQREACNVPPCADNRRETRSPQQPRKAVCEYE